MFEESSPAHFWISLGRTLAGENDVAVICATMASEAATEWGAGTLVALANPTREGYDAWFGEKDGKHVKAHWSAGRAQFESLVNARHPVRMPAAQLLSANVLQPNFDLGTGTVLSCLPLPYPHSASPLSPDGIFCRMDPDGDSGRFDQAFEGLAGWLTICLERALLHHALQKAASSGVTSSPSEGDLIRKFVHDTRTPLATVLLYVRLLRQASDANEPNVMRFLDIIEGESIRLQAMGREVVELTGH